jgi:DNA repair protein RecO (recombination protein O)
MSAFYLNELLLKLTTREDPHEGLFAAYDRAIGELRALSRLVPRAASAVEPVLRRFELSLLQELGYAVELARDTDHAPIDPESDYWYVLERGPVPAPHEGDAPANAIKLRGRTLIDLEGGRFEDAVTAAQAKQLMRSLIQQSLNGQELATRALVRDLMTLSPDPAPKGEGSLP